MVKDKMISGNRTGRTMTERVVGKIPLQAPPQKRAAGAPQNQMAHAEQDMMVGDARTPEDGMAGMNRAARRRAAKSERGK